MRQQSLIYVGARFRLRLWCTVLLLRSWSRLKMNPVISKAKHMTYCPGGTSWLMLFPMLDPLKLNFQLAFAVKKLVNISITGIKSVYDGFFCVLENWTQSICHEMGWESLPWASHQQIDCCLSSSLEIQVVGWFAVNFAWCGHLYNNDPQRLPSWLVMRLCQDLVLGLQAPPVSPININKWWWNIGHALSFSPKGTNMVQPCRNLSLDW